MKKRGGRREMLKLDQRPSNLLKPSFCPCLVPVRQCMRRRLVRAMRRLTERSMTTEQLVMRGRDGKIKKWAGRKRP